MLAECKLLEVRIIWQQNKLSNSVLFFQCVVACTFDVDLIVFVKVNSFLDRLKHVLFILWQWWRYVDRSTLYFS